jgi:hypothetical protein
VHGYGARIALRLENLDLVASTVRASNKNFIRETLYKLNFGALCFARTLTLNQ